STWLTNFKSVSTAAARYQNLAINQSKLSGQCGRLKCCLNFELDTYMEALKAFPKNGNVLKTEGGIAHLMKMDIFKGLMFYAFRNNKETRGKIFALKAERVKEIIAMNKKGERPESLQGLTFNDEVPEEGDVDLGFADVTGQIELPMEKRKKKKRKPNNNRNKNRQGGNKGTGNNRPQKKEGEKEGEKQQPKGQGKPNPRRKPKQNRKPNPKKQGEKPTAKNGNTNPQTKDNTAKPPTKDGKPNAEKRPNNKRGNRRPNRNNRNKNNRPPKGDGNKPTDSDKKT
ncbi:MAG: regulatory iron-sulfur-containing complex subunit RicT, partial [Saprospiraceae bacterium]